MGTLRETFALSLGFALAFGLALVRVFVVAMSDLLIVDIKGCVPRLGRIASTV